MKNELRLILFSVVLAIVCSLLLVGAEQLFMPFRDANERAEEVKNFLSALEVPLDENADSDELVDIFNNNIEIRTAGEIQLFAYIPQDSVGKQPVAFATVFSGPGLWGPIQGVLALESDLITIRGIRFYKQEETPGLGGEIGAEWFQQQFIQKKIVSQSGEPGFEIVKPGSATTDNQVDGITGATMTSDRVHEMIDKLAKEISKERESYVK